MAEVPSPSETQLASHAPHPNSLSSNEPLIAADVGMGSIDRSLVVEATNAFAATRTLEDPRLDAIRHRAMETVGLTFESSRYFPSTREGEEVRSNVEAMVKQVGGRQVEKVLTDPSLTNDEKLKRLGH